MCVLVNHSYFRIAINFINLHIQALVLDFVESISVMAYISLYVTLLYLFFFVILSLSNLLSVSDNLYTFRFDSMVAYQYFFGKQDIDS